MHPGPRNWVTMKRAVVTRLPTHLVQGLDVGTVSYNWSHTNPIVLVA